MTISDPQTTNTAQGQAPLPQADSAESSNASTGPGSEAGKAISSRNAVKHNLCSKSLTGTDLEEFKSIRARLNDEWEPSTETERLLLDQMALSQWRMDRALSLELNAFDDTHIDEKLLALAELQRLRTAMRDDAIRREKFDAMEREAAAHRELERFCFAPIAGAPQFVSQNAPATPPTRPEPDYDRLKAYLESKIGECESA